MNLIENARNFWSEWRVGSWLLGIGSALLVSAVFCLLFAYVAPGTWSMTQKVRSLLPFPEVTVGWRAVASFREVASDLRSVRHFYESQDFSSLGMRVDFKTEDGRKRLRIKELEIINKRLEDEAIREIAQGMGITITDTQAQRAVEDQLTTQGNDAKAASDRIMSLYGWTIPEFTEKVVLPSLYREALQQRIEADESRFAGAKGKAEDARKRLDDGRPFSDVATAVSEGRTADKGGDLGWFSHEDLAPELQDAAKNLKIGVGSGVIESDLGFHIIVVNDRKKDNGKDLVELSQIFFRKQSFGDWLTERMKSMPIRVLSPDYRWNSERAQVEFRDEAMRQSEADLLRNSQGDPSLLF
ncbi:MAG TPA: peptidylprolyl isomerase [Candidatus Fimivivens sp.]|nr:peptidylprolyl isomerase [Candidatus Fimivivens sp.]